MVALMEICRKAYASTLNCVLKLLVKANLHAEDEHPLPNLIYTPLFAVHNLIYDAISPQLAHLSPQERASLLRGNRFASLANAIIEDPSSPMIKDLGIKLPPRERIEELKRLPQVTVTPPEDGDRVPLPGERGGKKIMYAKGLLAPPMKKSKLGKLARDAKKRFAKLTGGGRKTT